MPNGGTVHIDFANVTLRENQVGSLKPGDYVKITFKDEGDGIPEERLSKIFEPYFTTKTAGSGLWLSTVLSIIDRHDGHISAESTVNVGTTFTIFIPAIRDTLSPASEGVSGVQAGHGKILVMDDEELIRNVAREILQELGYEVFFAKDGKEALEVYLKAEREQKPFDAVIMDLTIPGGMGGKEAVRDLLAVAPKAKVIVSSGYSMDPIMADYKKYGFCGVVCKPYNANEISETIAKAMQA
jgi:CheY-like chemotaxis protein